MDFGDILDAWEKQTARAGKKRTRTPTPAKEETSAVDPLTAWMRVNGVYDKDAENHEEEKHSAAERRRRLRTKKPDAILDLHGLTRDEAWADMESFFAESRLQGMEKVLLIHGKGNHSDGEAVLKRTVLQFIEKCPCAGESGHPAAAYGGSGATWVLLKTTVRGK
ncbi:MAG: Smr/MutS family protein [Spirochaetaceae bacterium]|jgi:DNA-nicking Smr family endonuclease|nr:Smr/MutS family protein [Spirochaetaceae bacterium]